MILVLLLCVFFFVVARVLVRYGYTLGLSFFYLGVSRSAHGVGRRLIMMGFWDRDPDWMDGRGVLSGDEFRRKLSLTSISSEYHTFAYWIVSTVAIVKEQSNSSSGQNIKHMDIPALP
jgi:hypothetical protein